MTENDTAIPDGAVHAAWVHNAAHQLEVLARDAPHAVALRQDDCQLVTFAQLDGMVARCAGGLRRSGFGSGDRIVVFVPLGLDLYVTLLAVLRIGSVVVFIDPWVGRRAIARAVDIVQPRGFVGTGRAHALRLLEPSLRRIPVFVVTGRASRALAAAPRTRNLARVLRDGGSAPVRESVAVEPHAHALVTFTTGSTGAPKGADRTHAFLGSQHDVLERAVEQRAGDVHVTNLPIVVLHNIARGVTTVLPPEGSGAGDWLDGPTLHARISRHRPTVLAMSPGPLAALATCGPLPSVERAYTGGGPVTPMLAQQLLAALPNARVEVLYGSTECEPIASCTAGELHRRAPDTAAGRGLYAGRPDPAVRVRIDGLRNGLGEVLVSGPHVNRSYFRDAAATARTKVIDSDGTLWHRTGDAARLDDDGALWLLGRLEDGVNLDGETFYPFQLELPVAMLPGIARAALARAPDGPVLAVQAAPGADPAILGTVTATLAELGAAALPLRQVDSIPLDPRHATKVDMPELIALLATGSRDCPSG